MSPTVIDSVAGLLPPPFPDLKNADDDFEKILLVDDYYDEARGVDQDEDDEPELVDEEEYYYEESEHSVQNQVVDDESSKAHLRAYLPQMIDQKVFIKRVPNKGRCLFARSAARPGDVIFVEDPVLAAIPSINPEIWHILTTMNEEEPLALPPVWHLAAITSLTTLSLSSQRIINNKFVPEPDEQPSRDVYRVLQRSGLALDPEKYQKTLNAWRFNGFGHHAESDGLILYDPTWHYGGGDAFVLRARKHLGSGDEITISYIGDEDLLKPTHSKWVNFADYFGQVRREKLSSWQFTCHCERCDDPIDRCRGFRCPDCGTGTVFIKSETQTRHNGDEEQYTTAQPCSV